MAAPSVAVIGGGVGGLTAAHELVDRGFSVSVYEARGAWGGKARSQPVPGTGSDGRLDLPGEHGFRFYPRFYRHVIDQMARTPAGAGTVADRLQPTTEAAIALIDDYTWYRFSRKQLDTPYSILEAVEIFFQNLDFDGQDVSLFGARLLQFATACDARRLSEYEAVSWWDFLDADRCSLKFQRQLRGIPRMMVAMDSVRGSARTIGTITIQLLMDFATSGAQNDRTMGGPTTQMWIDPWVAHLAARGVALYGNARATGIDVDGSGRVTAVQFADGSTAVADYYVLAAPLDGAIGLISPAMGGFDPVLDVLRTTDADDLVSWMVGIQYYLYEDVPLVRGHLFFPDSPWALTAISQPQFWRQLGLYRRTFGDGSVGGCISVDISEWDTPGRFIPKTAKQCTPDEIALEVWEQLKAALNGAGETVLTDDLRHSWHLDDDVDYSGGLPPANGSRLLVHPPGSWQLRPEARTQLANLALASDYVRTHTNIASMEGACEAGRRACNAILDMSGSTAGRSDVWPLAEPRELAAMRALDAWLHARGRPHLFEMLGIEHASRAAAISRRVAQLVGLARLDDLFDARFRLSSMVGWILARLGLR
ncbi:MAG: FAD-dependent oxidoreductase [Deltaproteobacteria bacterium]|nr:FAD-dependent oxidoreductase [Deltaproteobacteria bacterium]